MTMNRAQVLRNARYYFDVAFNSLRIVKMLSPALSCKHYVTHDDQAFIIIEVQIRESNNELVFMKCIGKD